MRKVPPGMKIMPHGAPLPSLENVCGDFVGTRTFITETYGGTPIHDDWTEGQRPICTSRDRENVRGCLSLALP